MLQLQTISKKYKTNLVLNHVNLIVEKAKLVHIKGINGSGKSTLFKIICNISEPDQGEVFLDKDTYIGALIENPSFLENETISFNLKFLASLKNMYNEDLIKRYCKQFQLDIHSKTKLKNYSVGMRQKVGIIQAIMEDQNLILLDEPTRGLDKKSIEIFEDIVIELVRANKTVIIASHEEYNKLQFDVQYELDCGILKTL